jgi:hypothetical protein
MKKILLAVTVLALMGCDDTTTTAPSETANDAPAAPEEVIEITAEELWATYDKNELAGDQAYKDKTLVITGVVDSIESGLGDTPYLTLRAGDEYNFSKPQAHFDKTETDSLVTLSKGDNITLKCKGNGEIMGSPMLSDCTMP